MPDDESAQSTILGIRLDAPLREKIKELAAAEGRTESGFVRFYLNRLVELEEAKEEVAR
jgi:predicted transcriptional regulator